MKKIIIIVVTTFTLMACANNPDTETGGAIDSAITNPVQDNPTDKTIVVPDTAVPDTNRQGAGTNSNSGAAKDDGKKSR